MLSSAISEGSIQVIYREPPVISDDRLMVTWTVDILLLDESIVDLIETAVRSLGFTATRTGEQIRAKRDWILTSKDRADLVEKDRDSVAKKKDQQREQANVQQQANVAELQAQVAAIREELELLQLMPAKRGPAGPSGTAGAAGRDGRDGSDLLATNASIRDLSDVADENPEQGNVLTWDDAEDAWKPKPPRIGGMSIAGGAGGGAGGDGQGLNFWEETEQGDLLPKEAGQSLGSSERPIKEIHVEGNTIFLDGFPLSLNANNRLAFDGNQLGYGDVLEAPTDGGKYVRQNGDWFEITGGGTGQPDDGLHSCCAPYDADGGDIDNEPQLEQPTNFGTADGGLFT